MTTPVYPENTDVTVTIALPVSGGDTLIPSAISRTVLDQAGVIVSPATDVPVPSGSPTSVDILVPATLNVIQGRREARVVNVELTTTQGVFHTQTIYLVEGVTQLVLMENTFVTEAEALMVRRDMPALDGWDNATQADRSAALITAHRSLCRLNFRYRRVGASQTRITFEPYQRESRFGDYTYVVNIDLLTVDEWNTTPDLFRDALKRAQLAQADSLLRGDPVQDKRRSGILQERIGESQMSFRDTPEVRMAVCREALDHVSGYLFRDTRIARGG